MPVGLTINTRDQDVIEIWSADQGSILGMISCDVAADAVGGGSTLEGWSKSGTYKVIKIEPDQVISVVLVTKSEWESAWEAAQEIESLRNEIENLKYQIRGLERDQGY